jgi:rRNA maturation endonuclease Nob1
MEYESNSQISCYVLDASSLIEIEGSNGKGLKSLPEYPGKWFVVPSKVFKEVNSKEAPKETKEWLNNGKSSSFSSDDENRLYMRLRVNESALDDADIQGIVIAYHRKGTYVVDDGPAILVAKKLGIRIMNYRQFLESIRPHLL